MIDIEERERVLILRLARGKGNALNLDLLEAFGRALDRLEGGSAQAGVITGQGNIFCAGVDLQELVEGGPDYVRRLVPMIQRGFERLAQFPKPIVAAVNGHAIAGGAIIMLACDQRLLARGAGRIGLTEARVGVTFPAWALEIVRFATPPQHFSTLVCTGRTWLPEDALSRGLVDELVQPEKLLDRAIEVAEELAAIPAAVFTTTKLAVRGPMIEAAQRQSALTDAARLEQWCDPKTFQEAARFAKKMIKRTA
jgi:enoyl-CoA hydratase